MIAVVNFSMDKHIPDELRNVLAVLGPEPCLIACRNRLRKRTANDVLSWAGMVPVLLVRNERDIERLITLLTFADEGGEPNLILSSLSLWRAA